MDQQQGAGSKAQAGSGGVPVEFTLGSSFGLNVVERPWTGFLPARRIAAEAPVDLVHIGQSVATREPDSALRHLPRFVLCNRVNTWGCKRGVPHAPKQPFHQFHGARGVRSLSVPPLARG